MTRARPGPKPRDPSTHRTVIVRLYLTEPEAARLDAVCGVDSRGQVMRAILLRWVAREEAGRKRSAMATRPLAFAGPWVESSGSRRFYSTDPMDHAALVDSLGWYAWHPRGGPLAGSLIRSGAERGNLGRALADSALRAAGYVLADGETP
jgi:hypothetical protein